MAMEGTRRKLWILYVVVMFGYLSSTNASKDHTIFHLNASLPFPYTYEVPDSIQQMPIQQNPNEPKPTIQELDSSKDLTCLGSGSRGNGPLIVGNWDVNDRTDPWQGLCIFNEPVQLVKPPVITPGNNTVTSFSSSFTLQTAYNGGNGTFSAGSSDLGLALIFTTSLANIDSAQGKDLEQGLENATQFAVVFSLQSESLDLHVDALYNKTEKWHAALSFTPSCSNYNITSSVCSQDGPNSSLSELSFRVWLDYDAPTNSVFVTVGDVFEKPVTRTGLKPQDGVQVFEAQSGDLFVGFSSWNNTNNTIGGNGNLSSAPAGNNGYFSYVILDWTFNSDGPAPDWPRTALGKPIAPPAPPPAPASAPEKRKVKSRVVLIACIIIAAAFVAIEVIVVLLKRSSQSHSLAKKSKILEDSESQARGAQRLSFKSLNAATSGLSPSDKRIQSFGVVRDGRE